MDNLLTTKQKLLFAGVGMVGGYILMTIGNTMTSKLNAIRFGCGAQSLFTGSQSMECFLGTTFLPMGSFLSIVGGLIAFASFIIGCIILFDLYKKYAATNGLDRAIEEDPGNPEVYNNRAHVYRLRKEYNKALSDLNKVIELDENHVSARSSRANIYIIREDWDKALLDLNKILTHNPHNAIAYNARGVVWENKYDFTKALSDYEKAAALEPTETLFQQNLAQLKAKIAIDKENEKAKRGD